MLTQYQPYIEKILDNIQSAICLLDRRGCLVMVNQTMRSITGVQTDAIAGRPIWSIPTHALSREQRQMLKKSFEQASSGSMVRQELNLRRRGQPEIILEITLHPISGQNGSGNLILVEGRDITLSKQTIQALHQSEVRFKTIFEEAGVGIVLKGVDGKMLDANLSFQAMLGYDASELVQLNYLSITHPLDRAASLRMFRKLLMGKVKSYTLEKRYLAKDGQIIWVRITTSIVHGQRRRDHFIIGMVENITAQKQVEEELAEVQRHLTHGREMERLRIAQDLHDGPLQEIIAMSFQAKELEGALEGNIGKEQLEAIQTSIHQLTRSVRSLCGELRPPTLVPFGLKKTIQSHADEFRLTHPDIILDLELARDNEKLPEQVRIILYRIYQEALNNVVRHSQAKEVSVKFHLDEKRAVLEIKDDGVGFDLPSHWIKLARQGHLGLIGAMERARDIGGRMRIKTAPGKGTAIQVIIPFENINSPAQGQELLV